MVLILFLALLLPGFALGSQIPNHLRVAEMAKDQPGVPPIIREILDANMDYYRAGAAGPDVLTNITSHMQPKIPVLGVPIGNFKLGHNAHYIRTGVLIRTLARLAAKEQDAKVREQYLAYMLGWLTHAYLDVYEHDIVNHYGGYYKNNTEWHKFLEMYETAHVFEQWPPSTQDQYVPKASAMPLRLVFNAFNQTYSESWRAEKDLYVAAAGMEFFCNNLFTEFSTQRRAGGIPNEFVYAKVGKIPLAHGYTEVMHPLWIAVDEFHPTAPGDPRSGMTARIDYSIADARLIIAYLSDWYASNDKALTAILDAFRRTAPFLRRSGNLLEIRPEIDPGVPDYDWDAGRLESEGDREVGQLSSKFKPVSQLEIRWEILDGQKRIAEDQETIGIAFMMPEAIGKLNLSIPPHSGFYSETESTVLKMKATIRMINSNPHLDPDPYARSFRFETGDKVTLVEQRKVPIEHVAERTVTIPRLIVKKKKETSSDPDVSLEELRSLAARAAALSSESKSLLASLAQKQSELENAAQNLRSKASAYGQLRNRLDEAVRAGAQESQTLAGWAAQSEASAQQSIQAKHQAEDSALEACEKALLIKNATSQAERDRLLPEVMDAAARAATQARASKEKYQESRKALEEIQRILARRGELATLSVKCNTAWDELLALVQTTQSLPADSNGPVQRIETIAAELQRISSQAAVLRQQILDQLKPFSTDKVAAWRKEVEQLYGAIVSAAAPSASHIAEARSIAASMQEIATGIRAVIDALQPPSSVTTAEDSDSLARADSAVAVADAFSEQAASAAASARACADASRSRMIQTPPDATGKSDWDEAAESSKSSTDTATNWDAAAQESSSSTTSETPQVARAIPEPDYSEPDYPEGYPDTDYPDPEYPDYSEPDDSEPDYSEQEEADREALIGGLIDLMKTLNNGSQQGNNPGIQNRPNTRQQQQQTNQQGSGCVIYADTRFANRTYHVHSRPQGPMTLISVAPAAETDKGQAALNQNYGRILSTHNNPQAAMQAARRICPNPVREVVH